MATMDLPEPLTCVQPICFSHLDDKKHPTPAAGMHTHRPPFGQETCDDYYSAGLGFGCVSGPFDGTLFGSSMTAEDLYEYMLTHPQHSPSSSPPLLMPSACVSPFRCQAPADGPTIAAAAAAPAAAAAVTPNRPLEIAFPGMQPVPAVGGGCYDAQRSIAARRARLISTMLAQHITIVSSVPKFLAGNAAAAAAAADVNDTTLGLARFPDGVKAIHVHVPHMAERECTGVHIEVISTSGRSSRMSAPVHIIADTTDLEITGDPYWRRSHQCVFYVMCPVHVLRTVDRTGRALQLEDSRGTRLACKAVPRPLCDAQFHYVVHELDGTTVLIPRDAPSGRVITTVRSVFVGLTIAGVRPGDEDDDGARLSLPPPAAAVLVDSAEDPEHSAPVDAAVAADDDVADSRAPPRRRRRTGTDDTATSLPVRRRHRRRSDTTQPVHSLTPDAGDHVAPSAAPVSTPVSTPVSIATPPTPSLSPTSLRLQAAGAIMAAAFVTAMTPPAVSHPTTPVLPSPLPPPQHHQQPSPPLPQQQQQSTRHGQHRLVQTTLPFVVSATSSDATIAAAAAAASSVVPAAAAAAAARSTAKRGQRRRRKSTSRTGRQ